MFDLRAVCSILVRERARDQFKVQQSLTNRCLMELHFLSYIVLQDGTEEYDYIYAAAGADDGSVIIAGNTYGSYGTLNAGSGDFVAVKIDTNGNTVWQWQVRVELH